MLRSRKNTLATKPQLTGCALGVLLTGVAHWLFIIVPSEESASSMSVLVLHFLALWPAREVCHVLHWKWPLDEHGISWRSLGLAGLTNAFLIWLIVTGAQRAVRYIKPK